MSEMAYPPSRRITDGLSEKVALIWSVADLLRRRLLKGEHRWQNRRS
jgi:hypothetical protein